MTSNTARNCLRDLSLSQKVWSHWLGVTPEKLSLLLSFTSFLKAGHTSLTQCLFCNKFVRELWKVEVLWSLTIGEVVSDLLYLLIQRSVQANVRPIVFDGSEYGCGETRLCSWNRKTLLWSCQVFSQSQFTTTPIQHFWLLRLRFIVMTD